MINELNNTLKTLGCNVSIVARGSSLYLRVTLPPKPNSGKINPHRQRIALGLKNNPENLERAKQEAIKLGALISLKEFDWSLYLKFAKQNTSCADWCNDFRHDYFLKRPDNSHSQQTYRTNYQQCFNKLPMGQKLSASLFKEILFDIPAGTRKRQRHAVAFQKLADFAGIDCDLKEYRGTYSHKALKVRNLPTDAEIVKQIQLISNPQWVWAAVMMATYGIRPHEIFFTDLSDPPLAYVTEGKTGARHISPLYPEWVEQYDLTSNNPPPHTGTDYTALGCRASRQFRRYGLTIKPYDLRHCYARRCKQFNITPIDAAKMMGHSLEVHYKIYHYWYCKDDVLAIAHSINLSEDRPQPPA